MLLSSHTCQTLARVSYYSPASQMSSPSKADPAIPSPWLHQLHRRLHAILHSQRMHTALAQIHDGIELFATAAEWSDCDALDINPPFKSTDEGLEDARR